MPRKTTILIIILALVTVGLLFMALRTSSPLTTTTPSPKGNASTVEKTAKLFFAPSSISTSSTSANTVDVMLDSGNSDITGVELVMSFDPKTVSSFTITAPIGENTYFGVSPTVLLNNVDLKNGRAEFSIATTLATGPKSGNGKVATIKFGVNRNSTLSSTEVEFLNNTNVVKHGEPESVLKEATPLTIQLKP